MVEYDKNKIYYLDKLINMETNVKSEIASEISDSMHELFRRLLGYYGRIKKKNQGPSLLGMETNFHERIPEAEEINHAVEELKEELAKARCLIV